MTIGNLIKPVNIKIEKIIKSTTKFNDSRREHGNIIKRSASFQIDAQVKFFEQNEPNMSELGVNEETHGYIIVRQIDLDAISNTINRGDKIIQLANRVIELFITKDLPFAQDETGNFRFIRYYFKDRN